MKNKKNKWYSFNEPVKPVLEKISISFSIGLALASFLLTYIAYEHQQENKDMFNLLKKQETLISNQNTQINHLANISNYNRDMIFKLDTTQRYILDLLNTTQAQSKFDEYSNRPILTLTGTALLYDADIIDGYSKFKYSIKNNGFRNSYRVKTKRTWVQIENEKAIKIWNESTYSNQIRQISPGETYDLNYPILLSEMGNDKFYSFFLIINIEYYDTLTKKTERIHILRRQQKSNGYGGFEKIILYETTEKETAILKQYINK